MPKQIPFGKPMIGQEEMAAVMDVMAGPILVHGPQSVQFENDFADFAFTAQRQGCGRFSDTRESRTEWDLDRSERSKVLECSDTIRGL